MLPGCSLPRLAAGAYFPHKSLLFLAHQGNVLCSFYCLLFAAAHIFENFLHDAGIKCARKHVTAANVPPF